MVRPEGDRPVLICDRLSIFAFVAVTVLDQQPVATVAAVTLTVVTHPHQHPTPLQLLTSECELQVSLAEGTFRIASIIRGPEATIPQHDSAAAVLALRDRALEVSVIEWMVLYLHRESAMAWIERWPFRDGPGFEHAVQLKP
jgi:hypothetical protein